MKPKKPKIGYKATYNFKCLDQTYEIGQTYTLDESSLKIGKEGYHYCDRMCDVLSFYPPAPDFILLEIEDLGKTERKENKSCTDKMKVLRVIPEEEYDGFEINGNTAHFKNSDGTDIWQEWDSNGHFVYYRHSNGDEFWREVDSDGELIKFSYSLKEHEDYLASQKE